MNQIYHCADCATQEEFYDKYGADYWMVGNQLMMAYVEDRL